MNKVIENILYLLLFLLMVNPVSVNGQDRMKEIQSKLTMLKASNSQLDEEIDISVSDLSIHEFLRGVAQSTGINISVDNSLDFKVANSFKGVVVYDLLLFLCRQYNLDLQIQGNIIHVSAYNPPVIEKKEEKNPVLLFTKEKNLLTIDVNNMELATLTKMITIKTGVNVLPEKEVRNEAVSGYVSQLPVNEALKAFCLANDLKIEEDKSNSWRIYKSHDELNATRKISKSSLKSIDFSSLNVEIGGAVNIEYVDGEAFISVNANEAPISGLIKYVSDSLKVDYSFVEKMDEKITVNMIDQTYDHFIDKLLKGTPYCCKMDSRVYYFTRQNDNTFGIDKRIQILNRTIENILANIPDALKEEVEIIELAELNSLFLSGEQSRVARLEHFIKEIDQVIPVILIEVLIVDVSKSKTVSTGINAGFGDNPEPAAQTIMPGIDYQLSTKSINSIFQKFEKFGWVNLGKVSPDFYFAIKALEENGLINVRSTPKLSALNGCKATLSSGETKYYKEEQSNYFGSQNPALSSSFTWKPINADMSVSILPVVSGDDQVTLEIEVQQSEFTGREFEDSPPGSVSRTFKSSIRVKNQEMVLLGGLDRLSSQNTGKGIPLLARIPVIKWLFSTKTKSTTNSKLNVFIQPTILN